MKAGILNEQINIYGIVSIINRYGEQQDNLVLKCTTRANVSWNTGGRAIENNEIVYNYTKTFTVRSYVEVENVDFIEWQGMKYRIISIEKRRGYNGKIILAELVNE